MASPLAPFEPHLFIHFTMLPPPEFASSRIVTMPRRPPRASRHSGRHSGLRPAPYASRRVPPLQEQDPSTNWKLPPPRDCAGPVFAGSGQYCLHRRHFLSGHPPSNSFAREYALTSLYLLQPLIRSLFFPRSPSPLELPRRSWPPSPAQLRSSPPPLTTPTLEFVSKIIDDQVTSLSEQYKQEFEDDSTLDDAFFAPGTGGFGDGTI